MKTRRPVDHEGRLPTREDILAFIEGSQDKAGKREIALPETRTAPDPDRQTERDLMVERTINNLMDLQIAAEMPLIQEGWEAPPPAEGR